MDRHTTAPSLRSRWAKDYCTWLWENSDASLNFSIISQNTEFLLAPSMPRSSFQYKKLFIQDKTDHLYHKNVNKLVYVTKVHTVKSHGMHGLYTICLTSVMAAQLRRASAGVYHVWRQCIPSIKAAISWDCKVVSTATLITLATQKPPTCDYQ